MASKKPEWKITIPDPRSPGFATLTLISTWSRSPLIFEGHYIKYRDYTDIQGAVDDFKKDFGVLPRKVYISDKNKTFKKQKLKKRKSTKIIIDSKKVAKFEIAMH